MTESNLISRIAPTPSGFLHVGNALNFLLTWYLVRKNSGVLSLRIDDMDATRKRPEYIEDIFRSLEWLGIDYDLGPSGPDDFEKNYSQVARIEEYFEYAKKIDSSYACQCSRTDIRENSDNGLYPGTCRDLKLNLMKDKTSLRLRLPNTCSYGVGDKEVNLIEAMGDFVLWRKDGLPSYQLVSVVEDLKAGTNTIVRGEDLIDSSIAQFHLSRELQELNYADIYYHHHPLLLDSDGAKLSKSVGQSSLKYHYERNESPAFVFHEWGKFLGIDAEINNVEELLTLEYNPDLFRIE